MRLLPYLAALAIVAGVQLTQPIDSKKQFFRGNIVYKSCFRDVCKFDIDTSEGARPYFLIGDQRKLAAFGEEYKIGTCMEVDEINAVKINGNTVLRADDTRKCK